MKEKDNVHHMHIELTREQYATLCAKAKKSGLTKRAFLVRLLEGREIRERPPEEIRQLREEVHRIGNNINPDCAERKRGNRHAGGRRARVVYA